MENLAVKRGPPAGIRKDSQAEVTKNFHFFLLLLLLLPSRAMPTTASDSQSTDQRGKKEVKGSGGGKRARRERGRRSKWQRCLVVGWFSFFSLFWGGRGERRLFSSSSFRLGPISLSHSVSPLALSLSRVSRIWPLFRTLPPVNYRFRQEQRYHHPFQIRSSSEDQRIKKTSECECFVVNLTVQNRSEACFEREREIGLFQCLCVICMQWKDNSEPPGPREGEKRSILGIYKQNWKNLMRLLKWALCWRKLSRDKAQTNSTVIYGSEQSLREKGKFARIKWWLEKSVRKGKIPAK